MDCGASSYRRYLDGEEAAFDEVMEGLFRNLVFFIDRYVRDVHEAEDLAMDTMTELLLHPKGFDFRVSLKTLARFSKKKKRHDFGYRCGIYFLVFIEFHKNFTC